MLIQALLAAAEQGLAQVLSLDSSALERLAGLQGKVIEIDCQNPPARLFLLPDSTGLRLAAQWQAPADCSLRAPAARLLQLVVSKDKSAVLHAADVDLDGDSAVLLELAGILQDLELDWEYQLSRWLGPVASQVLGSTLRSTAQWSGNSLERLRHNLADYLGEESRALVGQREAAARFNELDQLKLSLDRLDARIERLARKVNDTP
ncbi:ubiquinone biosynthesis accessory factor UbiJ [Pseudomonas sp. N040]|uniref:ubiquinone biosynthesis accessory factor UbiJ n=1 Tax=Pseudomonas sp. N040 TaxID=2785325 RepID=UPI0018A26DFB|nr:SCP2 sterol-binding domain-containing protein [Pseudomonas sp. N040]MBF7729904.1 SCP2 sterol-binding domain-containing protein [Pseudomonas sp. N040]MBW7013546.1 SCP2 sterol-binding domain-containing protein [Pseudomonas sp. N040]